MTKYRFEFSIEFETKTDIVEFATSGSMEQVGSIFDTLPSPADVDEKAAKAQASMKRVEAA